MVILLGCLCIITLTFVPLFVFKCNKFFEELNVIILKKDNIIYYFVNYIFILFNYFFDRILFNY